MDDEIVVLELEVQELEQVSCLVWTDCEALRRIIVGIDIEEEIAWFQACTMSASAISCLNAEA